MATLLNEKNKKLLEQQAKSITESDIQDVKQQLPKEFKHIEELLREHPDNKTLISVLKIGGLFYDILNNDDFYHHPISKKWIGFALKYLISPYDLIPDKVGTLGYYDDNMVLQWVSYLVEDEINRFKAFYQAEMHIREGELLEKVADGGIRTFILVPGLYTRSEAKQQQKNWVESIKEEYPDSTIYIFRWIHASFPELEMISQTMNHEILLKAQYDIEKLELNWRDAHVHAAMYAKALKRCLNELALPGSKVTIAGHSTGCSLICELLPIVDTAFESVIFLAAASTFRNKVFDSVSKYNILVNVYSDRDQVLKFLFEKLSSNHLPMGLKPISGTPVNKIVDIDMSDRIAKHSDYTEILPLILKEVSRYV